MEKLLIHICCAPCAVFPLKKILATETEVTGYFYNPNIFPNKEFQSRLDCMKTLAGELSVNVKYFDNYDPAIFLRGTLRADAKPIADNERCEYCYFIRLAKTVETAIENNCTAFTTTLLYSKFQKHELIKGICESLASKNSIRFYYEDFRDGWKEGVRLSRQMGLYRQNYCGCVFSKVSSGR